MRIKHKVHLSRTPKPPEISPKYQAELDRSTERLERRYREAQKHTERAQRRLEQAQRRQAHRRELIGLEHEVSVRIAELYEIELLMTSSPAGAVHRGTEGWTKVPR